MIRWLMKKVIKNIDVAGKNVEIVIKKLKYLNINVICNGNAKKVESVKKKKITGEACPEAKPMIRNTKLKDVKIM
jgi:3-deoxy-D-manno-octulosonate 8-phosphate phosphatase KdsC-like HAD superfamily phosphatase